MQTTRFTDYFPTWIFFFLVFGPNNILRSRERFVAILNKKLEGNKIFLWGFMIQIVWWEFVFWGIQREFWDEDKDKCFGTKIRINLFKFEELNDMCSLSEWCAPLEIPLFFTAACGPPIERSINGRWYQSRLRLGRCCRPQCRSCCHFCQILFFSGIKPYSIKLLDVASWTLDRYYVMDLLLLGIRYEMNYPLNWNLDVLLFKSDLVCGGVEHISLVSLRSWWLP